MEESGEQCNVFFALIDTDRLVSVYVEGPREGPPTIASSGTIYEKTTVHCSPYSSKVWILPPLGIFWWKDTIAELRKLVETLYVH
jgi:hypothetical protein